MAVKIRLARRGRKKKAIYDIVVADARAPRDGRFIEKLGIYNPGTNPASIVLEADKAVDWLLKGAQPTDTARSILQHEGVMLKKHLQVGVIKGAITQDVADARFDDWKGSKEGRKATAADSLTLQRDADKQAKLDAERKKNQDRADAIAKKNTPPAVEVVETEETEVSEEVIDETEREVAAEPEVAATEVAATEVAATEVAAMEVAVEPEAVAAEPEVATEPEVTAEVEPEVVAEPEVTAGEEPEVASATEVAEPEAAVESEVAAEPEVIAATEEATAVEEAPATPTAATPASDAPAEKSAE